VSAARSRWQAVCLLALFGCGIATYLTLYQWHVTTSVWDPVFGSASSEAVLTSPTSRLLPVPDAPLGAVAYLVEAGLAATWRRQPAGRWLLLVLIAGLAVVGVALVLVQLLVVHAWCMLCLCSAAIAWINAAIGGAAHGT
jgi:uncharacterized membrane protein